jgi:hypothetical protein
MTASKAAVIVNQGNVNVDQCGVQVVVTKGNVQVHQSRSVATIANHVTLENNSSVVFLFARNVDGEVKTQFGPKESALFGIMAGLAAGVVLLSGAMFGKKRKKK